MKIFDNLIRGDPLVKLIQQDNFVGWVYSIDYDTALIMTNDLWKVKALGIPHNSFLLAASFNPSEFTKVPPEEREIILLRVIGSAKLPQNDDLIRTKVDHFQQQTHVYPSADERDYDDITRNQMQFGGLECRVLGTFYTTNGALWLGSDLESFATATRLNVYRPRSSALEMIVNYIDPIRRENAIEEAKQLGIQKPISPFQIGTVRYTSTDRLHRREQADRVAMCIQPSDFLARRTAVLGMTRTGKSNMIKQMVAVVKRVADEGNIKIGQIIYDINGEYANANRQDQGSIADVYPLDTIRYRMLPTPGFEEIRNNFYGQVQEGFNLIKKELREKSRDSSDYVRMFVNMSFDEPDRKETGDHNRWQVRVAAYKVLLYKAGFTPPTKYKVKFPVNKTIREAVNRALSNGVQVDRSVSNDEEDDEQNSLLEENAVDEQETLDALGDSSGETSPGPLDPKKGLSLQQAFEWFEALRRANDPGRPLASSSGKPWVDDTLQNLLDMMVQKGKNNSFISGHRILAEAVKYHSPVRNGEVAEEIYRHLSDGKIVILDLSVGDPTMREKVSKQVAAKIFDQSMDKFINGKLPPNIVVYIEEAHNLIGKEMELTETWPRLAKEGAKYRIALVYATQEVSSVHPNILSNTENWFITHLNNDREIKELAKFYDFDDFSRSLMRAQDVGFARVKTLSGPFVVPVQIDKFDPEAEKQRAASYAKVPKAAEGVQPTLWQTAEDAETKEGTTGQGTSEKGVTSDAL